MGKVLVISLTITKDMERRLSSSDLRAVCICFQIHRVVFSRIIQPRRIDSKGLYYCF